jgi:uncharacterized repeat protein (TIGR01451 family)
MSGLWHIADSATSVCAGAHSGTHAFYFGRDTACNYNDAQVKDASLTSAPFTITGPADATLSFWTRWQVESVDPACFDKLRLEKSPDGVTWSKLADLGPSSNPLGGGPDVGMASGSGLGGQALWQFVSVDLSAYIGGTYRFRFRFLSGANGVDAGCPIPADSGYDNFLGWVIDDISLGCPPAPLSIDKSASANFAARGDTVTFTITARNWDSSPQTLSLSDSLPLGADFVSASSGGTLSGNVVNWSLPVAAGGSQVVTLVVTVDPSTPYPSDWLNTVSGSSSLGPPSFQSPQALVKIRAPGLDLKKTASSSTPTNLDQVVFSITLSNFSNTAYTEVDLFESPPAGFTEQGHFPAYAVQDEWKAFSLQPGEVRVFTVWGQVNVAADHTTLTNHVDARILGVNQTFAEASVVVTRPPLAYLKVLAVYPQPAPSFKAGLPQHVFVYYETNQVMNLTMDIFSVSGEKVRSLEVSAPRGKAQVDWDLKNSWGLDVASGIYVARLWSSTSTGQLEAWAHIAVSR